MFDLRVDGAIARLALDRPRARNAIPVDGWSELARRLDEAEAAGARVLILWGDGPAFCAGADLEDFPGLVADRDARPRFRAAMRAGIDRLRDLPIPTIALVEGPCYGAGVALAIACDLRIGSPAARFAITPATIGISYPQEDVHRLVSLVGRAQAARLLFTGLPIDAGEAARLGLLDLPPAEHARAAADGIAEAICAADAESVRVLKRGISLAAAGARSDDEQDRRFDSLFDSPRLAAALARRRG